MCNLTGSHSRHTRTCSVMHAGLDKKSKSMVTTTVNSDVNLTSNHEEDEDMKNCPEL